MKISYETDQSKCIYIKSNDTTHTLYPDETLDIESDESNSTSTLQIETEKACKMNVCNLVILFVKRFFLALFRIIFNDYAEGWLKGVDPFVLSASYKVESPTIHLRYIPGRIPKTCIRIREPQLFVNNKRVETQVEFDSNAVKIGFVKYCFDVVSVWIYCCALMTYILINSKNMTAIITCIIVLLGITIPVIIMIGKVYQEKERVLNHFTSN